MATSNPAVSEVIEKNLRKHPDATNDALKEKAVAVDPSIAKLDARQFNARFVLSVRRKLKAENGETPAATKSRPDNGDGGSKRPRGRPKGSTNKTKTAAPAAPSVPAISNTTVHNNVVAPHSMALRGILMEFAKELLEGEDESFSGTMKTIDKYVVLAEATA